MMEDSGIDSGDTKPFCDTSISGTFSPKRGIGGVPTSRIMQKRSGARNRNQEGKKCSGSLLPLQRLPIPGGRETQPLVAWDTDDSEEEVVSFFPAARRSPSYPGGGGAGGGGGGGGAPTPGGGASPQEPLDSLSVEELSPTDEDEGDDLELVLPPGPDGAGPSLCCGARFCCLL